MLLLLALEHLGLLDFLNAEAKRPVVSHELFLEVHALEAGLNVCAVPFRLKRDLHLLAGDDLYF